MFTFENNLNCSRTGPALRSINIIVRTCASRKDRALRLGEALRESLNSLYTGGLYVLESEESPYFSQSFLLGLSRMAGTLRGYVLIVEDDIIFTRTLADCFEDLLQDPIGGDIWLSLESEKLLLFKESSEGEALKIRASVLSYSGAILLSSDTLRGFCEDSILNFMEMDPWKFDLSMSMYLSRKGGGSIWVRPGLFATDPACRSLLGESGFGGESRVDNRPTQDFGFDFGSAVGVQS